ncbi:MAG: hemolysin family protein [Deltaproteobacteria bacterium]|nr:hemolysin family protein [Deltaproteobacteria bacterium]
MSNFVLETLVIFVLIAANGLLAMSEIAIVAARKARLQQWANSGDAGARAALELATHPNRFLATGQIGITLVGILAGAFGGATLAHDIEGLALGVPALAPYGGIIGVGVVVVGITFFSLVLGELAPKRIALVHAERIASTVAAPMRFLSFLAFPLVRLLGVSTDIVLRIFKVKPSLEPHVTPEEIRILVEQGTALGVFEESEQDMIEGVLRLNERPIGAFMTPRTQIVRIDVGDSSEILRAKIVNSRHSRFPVIQGNFDNVLGIVSAKNILKQSLGGQPTNIRLALGPPLFVPETASALKALELFKREGTHFALVTDEYGGIQGLVTDRDILEAIVGELPSRDEPHEPEVTVREDGSWLVDGLLNIDRLKEILEMDTLPDEESGRYHTVSGFMMTQLGGIPAVGQHFEWKNFRFEVMDMDGRRVDKVLIARVQDSKD